MLENGSRQGPANTNRTEKLKLRIRWNNVRDMASRCAMAYVTCIASELDSAAPIGNIIPQKYQREESQEGWLGYCVRCPPHSTPLLLPEGMAGDTAFR